MSTVLPGPKKRRSQSPAPRSSVFSREHSKQQNAPEVKRESHWSMAECFRMPSTELEAPNEEKEAVRVKNRRLLARLLRRPDDVNVTGEQGMTALHFAAGDGSHDVVMELLNSGARIDAVLEDGRTPLHCAARKGHRNVVEALIQRGANIDAQDKRGMTPLHHATIEKKESTALKLIQQGASLTISDSSGKTPLECIGRAQSSLKKVMKTVTRREAHASLRESVERLEQEDESRVSDLTAQNVGRSPALSGNPYDEHERGSLPVEAEHASPLSPVQDSAADSFYREKTPAEISMPQKKDSDTSRQPSTTVHWDLSSVQDNERRSNSRSRDDKRSGSPSSTSGSDSESPFGEKTKFVKALDGLRPDQVFHGIYKPAGQFVPGKMQIRLAMRQRGKPELVVLKFYSSKELFENALEAHEALEYSKHICKLSEVIEENSNFPPCLVLERGTTTLNDWLSNNDPEFAARKWCLNEILKGIRDMHQRNLVHNDLKPSNIMFFGEAVTWKLIDLDETQRNAEGSATRFTPSYAPPEFLEAVHNGDSVPLSRSSKDMWSFGVIAFEVITARRFYGDNVSVADALECLKDGKVEQNLMLIPAQPCRSILANLLTAEPEKRWTAEEVLRQSGFKGEADHAKC